jgi:putative FmdB family regulatory protein
MPTYDYRCSHCGHEFEEFQAMSAEPLKVCPKCSRETLKRALSGGAGMIFRGEGFYLTDYKKGENKKKESEKKKENVQEMKKSGEGSDSSIPKSDPT